MVLQGTHQFKVPLDAVTKSSSRRLAFGCVPSAPMAVRDFAFQHLQLPHLVSLIRKGNLPSKRVAEKIGMRYISEYQNGLRHYWKYEFEVGGSHA